MLLPPHNLRPVHRMIRGGIGRQDIHWIARREAFREEDLVDAVFAGHIRTVRADLGRMHACSGVDIHRVDPLIGFLIIPQDVISHSDHILLAGGLFKQCFCQNQRGKVRSIGMDVKDRKTSPPASISAEAVPVSSISL